MHKEETINDYHIRINKVKEYINTNLGEHLDIEKLASISNFSVFHFHRIMRAHLDEPLYAYIIRLRLEAAAHMLKHSLDPVSDIAYSVGYDTPAAFINAFGRRFGISPGEYRAGNAISITKENSINNKKIEIMKEPKIKEIKPQKVIYYQCSGEYSESAKVAWETLCDFMKKKKLWGFGTKFIGISYDDPTITEASKLRYEACITIKKEVQPEGKIGVKQLAGGKYAIFRHNGPYEKFSETYNYIFSNWMTEKKAELRNVPCFELYVNSPDKAKPENLKTDIYIPIL
jgi:AraC family transcriptional regulator